jgi:predicted DCC family thiol-disulfide oxidoreductase YuxK
MQRSNNGVISIQSTSETSVADQMLENRPTIYFDGSCALCSVEINHYASRVGGEKLGFIDVSRDDVQLGADLTSDTAMRRFHVRRPDGSLVSGARAFVEVWDTLPGWQWATRVARIRGVLPVLEVGYRAFLPIRPFISNAIGRFSARNTPK